jgi:hypothetical protein
LRGAVPERSEYRRGRVPFGRRERLWRCGCGGDLGCLLVLGVLEGCWKGVGRVLEGCWKGVGRVLGGS